MKLSELDWYDPPEVNGRKYSMGMSQPLEREDGIGNTGADGVTIGWQAWRSETTPYAYAIVLRMNGVSHQHERFDVDAFTFALLLQEYRPAPKILGSETQ